jgi:hypothetical protein
MTLAVTERAQSRLNSEGGEGGEGGGSASDRHPDGNASAPVEDPTREIVLATYRGDAVLLAKLLRGCTSAAVAEMSLTRSAAVELLGDSVYLGSHSWSTQEGFPIMYFAGESGRGHVAPGPP